MEERISGWTYAAENGRDYVDLLDNSGEITYSPVSGICGGVPSSCETTANFSYNIGLVDWTMSGDDPCNIVKAVGGIPSCNQEMFVCWFNGGSNLQYNRLLTDYGATLFIRKNVDECNHVMIISGDPSTQDYSNYQFVHGNGTQYFSTTRYTDSGYPVIATDPNNVDFSPKYRGGTTYAGHKIKYLPNTDTISGECIVNNPNLVELYFPSYSKTDAAYSGCTIKHIGNGAFHDNVNLSAITLNAVETIGDSCFSGCSNLVNIDWGLKCCNKSSNVTSIGDDAFNYCTSLTSIDIPNSVTSIGNSAFQSCTGLTSITFENNSQLTSIGNSAFYFCYDITSITIPNSVISIGNAAFAECDLESITIPNSVKSIGKNAFGNNLMLTSVTIGSGVISIGKQAFIACSSLASITSLATTAPSLGSDVFDGLPSSGTLYVPYGSTGYDVWQDKLSNWEVIEQ